MRNMRWGLIFMFAMGFGSSLPARAADGPQCRVSENAIVVSQPRRSGVGEVVVVKARPPGPVPPCRLVRSPGDFVLDDPNDALSVSVLEGPFLVIEAGTGPLRTLRIYDVTTREKRLDTVYDDAKGLHRTGDTLTFWTAGGATDAAHCPAYKAWVAQGLGAMRTEEVKLGIPDGGLVRTGTTACMATQ